MQNKIYFTNLDGRIATVTPYNTKITHTNGRDQVRIIPTVVSRVQYVIGQTAEYLRWKLRFVALVRRYSLF